MSRKKKYPPKWIPCIYEVELYRHVGWLNRKRFYVIATTYRTAMRKIKNRGPEAEILMVAQIASGAL